MSPARLLTLLLFLSGFGGYSAVISAATDCSVVTEIPQAECEMLVSFYDATGGSGWTNQSGWKQTNTPCAWQGVVCSGGHVFELNLWSNQLSGSIPEALNFPQLSRLSLDNNNLTGSIPNFSNLPQLTHLTLHFNNLTGTIPDFLNLPQLNILFLHENTLSGEIPDFSALSQLNVLGIDSNDLCYNPATDYGDWATDAEAYPACSSQVLACSGVTEIPVSECESLITLYDSTNGDDWDDNTGWKQTDTPCSWYGITCTGSNVTEIDLRRNGLTGTLPDLTHLPQLDTLYLVDNEIGGTVPNFSSLPELTHLVISINSFTGEVPDFTNLPKLTHLHISGSNLTGGVPDFTKLPLLEELYLHKNTLTGNIVDFTNLPELRVLWLYDNEFTGIIPDFENLANLNKLHVGHNALTGTIPDFSGLANLTELYLSNNSLSGALPDFSNLPNLRIFQAYSNNLTGNLPNFSGLSNLEALVLHSNQLAGAIPNFVNLSDLDISNNTELCRNPSLDYGDWSTHVASYDACSTTILFCPTVTEIPGSECESLITLYDSTDGDNWTDNTGWIQTNTPCSWHGITCESGHVTNIQLSGNNLTGTLPDIALSELNYLTLKNNQLEGTLPGFSGLPALQGLDLENNVLDGEIPNFNSLPNLQVLVLANNRLDGTIPDLNLPALVLLNLQHNRLDYMPDFSGLPSLLELNIGNNSLVGTIPDFSALPTLKELHLPSNRLTGSIPNFSNLPNLYFIQLYNNQLSGNLPDFNLPSLDIFAARRNNLTGTIPDFSNMPELRQLHLHDNNLTGVIPSLSSMPRLTHVYLADNQLEGTIPDFNLPSLYYFTAENNQLNGQLPSFANTPNLNYLLLDNNELIGELPDFQLSRLLVLSLKNNNLTGLIPNFTGLPKLQELFLENNQLTGEMPNFINLNSLDTLVTYNNNLCRNPNTNYGQWSVLADTFPSCSTITLCTTVTKIPTSECEALVNFYAETNGDDWNNNTDWNITNTPCSWHGITCQAGRVNTIVLSNNNLMGNLPDLSPLAELQTLQLDNNQLSGTIPNFEDLPELQQLQLAHNQFSGEIPNFTDTPKLQSLLLNDNALTGNVPNFFNIPQLTVLDLSNNNLTGNIPNFVNLPALETLQLNDNQLSGALPEFDNLPQLQVLGVSENALSGDIPTFTNMLALETVALKNNALTGEIPSFENQPNLENLTLSNNALTGSIPEFLTSPQLREIHLDGNNLSGSIPDLSHLTQLVEFDVTSNLLCIDPLNPPTGINPDDFPSCDTLITLRFVKRGTGSGDVLSDDDKIACDVDCRNDTAAYGTDAPLVTLTATPDALSRFSGWSGACQGTELTTQVTVDRSKTCIANFTLDSGFRFTLQKANSGSGRVRTTSADRSINCGNGCRGDVVNYPAGATTQLKATAEVGSVFSGWSGDCSSATAVVSVVMDADKTCTAQFDTLSPAPADMFTLTIEVLNGTAYDLIEATYPQGILCGDDCMENYPAGATVNLVAKPYLFSSFIGWGGDCAEDGNSPRSSVIMDSDKTCEVIFKSDYVETAQAITEVFFEYGTFLGTDQPITDIYPEVLNEPRLVEAFYYMQPVTNILDVQVDEDDLANTWPNELNDRSFYHNFLNISGNLDKIQIRSGTGDNPIEVTPDDFIEGYFIQLDVIMIDIHGDEYIQPVLISYGDLTLQINERRGSRGRHVTSIERSRISAFIRLHQRFSGRFYH